MRCEHIGDCNVSFFSNRVYPQCFNTIQWKLMFPFKTNTFSFRVSKIGRHQRNIRCWKICTQTNSYLIWQIPLKNYLNSVKCSRTRTGEQAEWRRKHHWYHRFLSKAPFHPVWNRRIMAKYLRIKVHLNKIYS